MFTRGKNFASTAEAVKMLSLQHHRGPDDAGLIGFSLLRGTCRKFSPGTPEAIEEGFEGLLGFNRLSIVDLSVNGHQPMSDHDGQVILAFNGEIYNAPEYRKELQVKGYRFRGHSDTEVILNLYMEFGFEEMVGRLNGMFAIVLVDLRNRQLFLARDRFGIKPLYIMETSEKLSFSSEIKSFTALEDFKPELRRELLDEYLLFRNTINRTLFSGVNNLEPGRYRVYKADGSQIEKTFFDIESLHRSMQSVSLDSSKERLGNELGAAVRRQLVSDVKVGCQLSGGVDSSLVTYYAQKELRDKLETVSITFEDEKFSEETYMETVVDSLHLKSHRYPLEAGFYADAFKKATWHFEAPLNHPNTIGIYLLSQKASEHVTVLLSGEGADEVFGGYGRFAQVCNPWSPRNLASWLRRNVGLGRHGFQGFSDPYRAILSSSFMTPALAERLYPEFSLTNAIRERQLMYEKLSGSRFDRQVKYEIKSYLPDLLMRQDKMSMAHSIENRVPFLDNQLVSASFDIPVSQLLGNRTPRQSKWILKLLAASPWGDAFAFRNKAGFSIPVRRFFADKKFNDYLMEELLPDLRRREWFEFQEIEKWVRNIRTIAPAELDALWIIVAFEAWAIEYDVK